MADVGIATPAGGIPTGLLGSEEALRRALEGATGAIETGITRGADITQPFAAGGTAAFNLQGALSGALGPETQQQAFADFQASPGQQFLTGEAERSLLRNQAAIGGLGGGNVRRALQEQAVGLAQQDFGNQFGRLGQVAGLGGQFAGQQAAANIAGGQNLANLAFGTGQTLAGGRTRAGEQIAQAIGGTTSALANLASQQGAGVSDILGGGGGNLANILSQAGAAQGLSSQQLATILANLSTGQASQIAGLPTFPGVQQVEGQLGNIGNLVTAFGTL